jgi:hypothetical protein
MAGFNLQDYETVEERIRRFYKDHPDGRIITENLTTPEDRERGTWVVKAIIFYDWEELSRGTPKATGLAFELDGGKGPNQTSALENCETSAIGRALANAGFSGNKRASREEMEKVERAQRVAKISEQEIDGLKSKADARALWVEANKIQAPKDILERIAKLAESLPE